LYNSTECIPPGDYKFIINDSYGDGICCSYGLGQYIVAVDGKVVEAAGNSFSYTDTTLFYAGDKPIDSSTESTCPEGEYEFVLSLTTDNYGSETSWDIKDSSGDELASESGYASGSEVTWTKCLPGGEELTFAIYDSYGDGICCMYGEGSYEISFAGNYLTHGGEFGASESHTFGYNLLL
jgi:hypothetical protein